jgi:hypothetical protein
LVYINLVAKGLDALSAFEAPFAMHLRICDAKSCKSDPIVAV